MSRLILLLGLLLSLAGTAQARLAASGAAGRPATMPLEELEALARRSPRSPQLRHLLVRRYAAQGEGARALSWAREAARLQPGTGESFNSLGVALQATGNTREARVAFRKAARRSPKLTEAYLNLGDLAMLGGEPKKAVDEYDLATVVSPRSVEAWMGYSRALAQLGYMNQARDAATQVIQIQPRNPAGYIALGEMYADQGRQSDARPPLERAWQLGDRSPKLHALLALAYADQPRGPEDLESALRLGETALAQGERSSQLYFGLGLAYQRTRRFREAIRSFEQLLEVRSAAHGAWVCLSQCYHALGQTEKAQNAARTAQRIISERQVVDRLRHQIQQAPHRLELRQQLAEHGMKTRNYFVAADQYAYLAKQVPNGTSYWRLTAKALHLAGAKEQAAQAEQYAREGNRAASTGSGAPSL